MSADEAAERSREADANRSETRYERRYRDVLDAAAAVFAEKGYLGASTKDIAQRLGIRQGSLYYYFTSKEAALEEVCFRGTEGFLRSLREIAGSDSDPREKIRAVVRSHLAPLWRDPDSDYVRVFLHHRQYLTDAGRRRVGALAREYEVLLERILREGISAGALPRDLDCRLAALALIGLCNSVATWHGRRPATFESVSEAYADWFLAGVTATKST